MYFVNDSLICTMIDYIGYVVADTTISDGSSAVIRTECVSSMLFADDIVILSEITAGSVSGEKTSGSDHNNGSSRTQYGGSIHVTSLRNHEPYDEIKVFSPR